MRTPVALFVILFVFSAHGGEFADTVESGVPFVAPMDRDDVEISDGYTKACLEGSGPAPAPTSPAPEIKPKPAPPPPPRFIKVDPSELPAIATADGSIENLKASLKGQLDICKKSDLGQKFNVGIGTETVALTKQQWCVDTNSKLLEIAESSKGAPDPFKDFMEKAKAQLDWYKPTCAKVQFTGFNSPSIKASRFKYRGFKYPIYKTPPDLVLAKVNGKKRTCKQTGDQTVCPYDNRVAIEGRLPSMSWWDKQKQIIGYVEDPLDITLLQIEGAGTLEMTEVDGHSHSVHVNFDTQNGRANYMLGKIMRCMGINKANYATTKRERAFFKKFRHLLAPALALNPSYTFFKEEPDGPYGSSGAVLIPKHSLATDTSLIPTGAAVLFRSIPSSISTGSSHSAIGNAADKGGSINGCHIDVFQGAGEAANDASETMNDSGEMYLGLTRPAAL